MKKELLSTILMAFAITFPTKLWAQDNIQFEDDAVKAICIANWDTNGDGELSYTEAAAVTDLGEAFKNTGIVRFSELEYFTGLTAIGEEAFYWCFNLREIRLPQTITSIGSAAFFEDYYLTCVELPEGLKTIEHAAFGICPSLKSLFIPASVTAINCTAFRDCIGLESIVVDEQNTVYDSRNQCNAIIETKTNTLVTGCKATVIPEGIVAIGRSAFYGHDEIKTLDFPSTLKILGESCLNGTGFVTVEIPNSVTTIESWAFTNCHFLESIRISSSVIHIEPFINCERLKSIVVDEGNTVYDSRNNCNGIIETATNTIILGCNTTIIPDGVESIGYEAFAATYIQSITIPESVISIEEAAFLFSSIKSIELPEKILAIGINAFFGCDELESIRSYIKRPFVINESTFSDETYQNATLFVRTGTKTTYQNTTAWKHFANIEEFGDPIAGGPEPYAVLSDNNTVLTFYFDENRDAYKKSMNVGQYSEEILWKDYQTTITNVVFDDSFAECTILTSTAEWFAGLSNLTTITALSNLKTDNVMDMHGMFSRCSSLTALDLSSFNTAKVTNMYGMFSGCCGLTNLDVSGFKTDKVTKMYDMFSDCSGLINLDVSGFNTDNVTRMDGMFRFCSSLTSLDVSGFKTGKVTKMELMFSGCSILTSLIMGSHFTSNESTKIDEIFKNCPKLNKVTYTGDIPSSIKSNFFEGVGTAYTPATLVVPDDYQANYQAKFDGNMFFGGYFSLNATSVVDGISGDENSYDVYSLSGVMVKKGATSLNMLPKGVYIVNGRKVVIPKN